MQIPITAIYASLIALILIFLASRVVLMRRKFRVGIGGGDHAPLKQAIRVHANATEYLPIALILMVVYELNSGTNWLLHLFGIALIIGRLLHLLGLSKSAGISFGRFYGTAITWLTIITLSILNIINFMIA